MRQFDRRWRRPLTWFALPLMVLPSVFRFRFLERFRLLQAEFHGANLPFSASLSCGIVHPGLLLLKLLQLLAQILCVSFEELDLIHGTRVPLRGHWLPCAGGFC